MFGASMRPLRRASTFLSASVIFGSGAVDMRYSKCHGSALDSAARLARLEQQVAEMSAVLKAQFYVQSTSGQGDMVFSWAKELTDAFPTDAKGFEADLHGGFSEDPDTGIVYTGIPGYGMCSISPDLKCWERLGTDERLKGNIHGIAVFKHGGETFISVAQNDDSRVLIVSLHGKVLQQLDSPKGGEFNFDEANAYYSEKPSKQCPWGTPHRAEFACTDVTYLNGRLYVVTGYCEGDFVLSASQGSDKKWHWWPIAWGGKGDAPGKFQTAHGVFAHKGHIYVANREAHQVIQFTPEGRLVRMFADLPDTARICNVAHADDHGYFVMNALEPIQHTPAKTASVYAHTGDELVSIINPGELGVPVLKHLHHVWPHYVTGPDGKRTLYLLLCGWSRGKFAVLKHEEGAAPTEPNLWQSHCP